MHVMHACGMHVHFAALIQGPALGFGGHVRHGAPWRLVIGASAEGGIRQQSTDGPRHDAKQKKKDKKNTGR